MAREHRSFVKILLAVAGMWAQCAAQVPVAYQPTLESLDRHPLPQWYDGAKLGIFICWGPYSVPGWAPVSHPDHDFSSPDYIKNNPYAEWYLNVMRIPGSPTQAYHREHYGADFNYYDFVPIFNRAAQKWNPDEWATTVRESGAKYVVLTTKFHDGFTLWPSTTVNPNPSIPQNERHAERDIVGELTAAVRKEGMKMGLYYSGGYDWTFNSGPIETPPDYERVKPESQAYGDYAFAQIHELVDRYQPSLLWNDIDWPKTGKPLEVEADYYNAVPDGVIDDRFGVAHADFTTPEYKQMDGITLKKWEECRGLGASFGYNRAEGEAETISSGDLIALLVDVVSKNGNLLLDVGPEADGTIPPVQMERLKALGAWLKQNGEAIYDTVPWTSAVGRSVEDDDLRFTRKGSDLYVIVLGSPKTRTETVLEVTTSRLPELSPAHTRIYLLGDPKPLQWTVTSDSGVHVTLPQKLTGQYAYVLKVASCSSCVN
jgi:alpha-L-fucosidase